MYDENSMKNHIFWLKFRRVFLLILFTVLGTSLGVVISDYIVNILLFPSFLRIIIVSVSAVLFLAFALLITATTGKEVQDSYWKIAVYKKLVVISKKLDNLDSLENQKSSKKESIVTSISKETKEPPQSSNDSETITSISEENLENNNNDNNDNNDNNSNDKSNNSFKNDLNDLSETLNKI